MAIDQLPQFLHARFLYTHFYVKRKVSLKVQMWLWHEIALSKMFPPCLITMHITPYEIITEGFLLQREKMFCLMERRQKQNCEWLSDRILHVDSECRYGNAKY